MNRASVVKSVVVHVLLAAVGATFAVVATGATGGRAAFLTLLAFSIVGGNLARQLLR